VPDHAFDIKTETIMICLESLGRGGLLIFLLHLFAQTVLFWSEYVYKPELLFLMSFNCITDVLLNYGRGDCFFGEVVTVAYSLNPLWLGMSATSLQVLFAYAKAAARPRI